MLILTCTVTAATAYSHLALLLALVVSCFILDWSHGTLGAKTAVLQYAPSDFSKAMLVIPVCLILCLFVMSFIRETHANEQ